jgi:mannose-6-phosphate isomerase-like protein (cupin superfamily)
MVSQASRYSCFAALASTEESGPSGNGPVTYIPVDIVEKLRRVSDRWSPETVARLNDYEIKVVKLAGEFVWHTHQDTDELFLVISGQLTIQMRDGNVTLGPGQLFVVPRGVEHCPLTLGEVHAVLIEPLGVVNTGDTGGSLTAVPDDSLAG